MKFNKNIILTYMFIFLLFLIINFIFILNYKQELYKENVYKRTEGYIIKKIVRNNSITLDNHISYDYSYEYEFTYKVDNKKYINTNELDTSYYNFNDKVNIYYNPKNPKESVLELSSKNEFIKLIIINLFFIIGFFFLNQYIQENKDRI